MTDELEQKELMCPNCGTKALSKERGAKIVCTACGGTFSYVAGEAKLQAVGELDKLTNDVEQLKAGQAELAAKVGMPAPPTEQPPAHDELEERTDWQEEDEDDEL
jgi:ribosomal protein L37AE/L43A